MRYPSAAVNRELEAMQSPKAQTVNKDYSWLAVVGWFIAIASFALYVTH